jgi:hypothetical protein
MITSLRNGSALVFAYKLENKLEQQLAQLATLSQELEMATSTFPSMKILNTIPPRVAENPTWRHAGHYPHHNKVHYSREA